MAGTRRRSRIPQSGDSYTAAAASARGPSPAPVVERAAAATTSTVAGDESSTHEGAPSRSTLAVCRQCKGVAGAFDRNAWHKITGTYYLPTAPYSSRLRETGKKRMAASGVGSYLEDCHIQPLACVCDEVLGFTVVDAPASKHAFRGRTFFKLPRIELRCEISPKEFITVEPHVEAIAAPLLPVDGSARSSAVPAVLPAANMEVDTRQPHASQPQPPPSGLLPHLRPSHEQHHDQNRDHHHQPLRQVEANSRQPSTARSPEGPHALHAPPQKSPSNPLPSPAVKPVHNVQYSAQPPPKEANVGLTNRSRDLPPVISHPHSHSNSPAEHHRMNGQYYPRPPQDVGLDAIERLQTQISQNSGALNIQSRDLRRIEDLLPRAEDTIRREFQTTIHHQNNEIRRVDEAVGRLQHEMMGIRELLEALTREVSVTSRELQNARANGQAIAGPSVSAQDSALELMANQVSIVSQKANEVDTLKITIEIMKNKIQRLEEAASGPALQQQQQQQQAQTHPFPSPREPTVHSAHSSHTVPSYHTTPSTVPHINTPVHPVHRPQPFHSHGNQVVATPEVSQRAEPAQTPSGWVTVNANAKRAHPHTNGVDGPHEHIVNPSGSPKRPKLAPIEPRVAFSNAQQVAQHQHIVYDQHMDTDDSESRIQTHTHSLPQSQTTSRESLAESTLPSQHAAFVAYHTQDAPSEDSWRPESQRIVEHRTPRGRGRGGGPGSRGGRGRKSLPTQIHLGTPEWEKDDWQGVKESQMSPEGFYSPARSRPFVRRGSGGGGGTSRGGRPSSSSDRAASLGLQSATSGVGLPSDPYAHTKKTRTKPTRNADGVLIRKDGRPDMRSQSSAANLRKVHARKEELGKDGREFTPASSFMRGENGEGTPSPTMGAFGQDLTASVQKKHSMIMGKIFPTGVDASRKEHDYARQVFEEGQDHTAHPRNQHHHHHHHHVAQSPLEIKREQMEDHRMVDSQSPNDGDVDMDRAEDHADDEGQTPSERSELSQEEERGRTETRGENGTHLLEQTQTTADTTQTVS
ncbi:hypothetical protein P154DRAFT_322604 [Amniculicola lignicola CBS 123094]|uniref:Uncharacterized protein n=1 Tax=Amniculicola lignicola CBS 123094 TaxID=1392246 RepID=A0A6A5W846_9PLEO|nr:hypothetical protein P154DRAFT_322604 [Amniculicola lignicola CBS 123094]